MRKEKRREEKREEKRREEKRREEKIREEKRREEESEENRYGFNTNFVIFIFIFSVEMVTTDDLGRRWTASKKIQWEDPNAKWITSKKDCLYRLSKK